MDFNKYQNKIAKLINKHKFNKKLIANFMS